MTIVVTYASRHIVRSDSLSVARVRWEAGRGVDGCCFGAIDAA